MTEARKMTDDKILRWLVDFGTDWVDKITLTHSWANGEIQWADAVKAGWLNESLSYANLKLSQKALDKLKENYDE